VRTPSLSEYDRSRRRIVKVLSVAEYIIERLAAEGINHCFGVAGDMCFQSAM
jgi:hypothetical protein